MDKACTYEIRVEGHLPEHWSAWFDGLAIHNDSHGQTALRGVLVDQAALFGLLNKIHALNLTLIALNALPHSPLPDPCFNQSDQPDQQ